MKTGLYFLLVVGASLQVCGQSDLLVLENNKCKLTIDRWGGAFTSFTTINSEVNPLSWVLTSEQMPANNQDGAPFSGHFLCLGRWGSPSEGEIAAGIPHNGEQSNTYWEIEAQDKQSLVMTNAAPLDYLTVTRTVQLDPKQPTFLVIEEFKNVGTIGRLTNVVQHVTLGPPYLNDETVVLTNAKQGFNQSFSYPKPHAYEYNWPNGIVDTTAMRKVNMSTSNHDDSYVSTHVFDDKDEYGYVIAFDPKSKVMLGYVWKLADYPWINIWHQMVEGKLWAKGLEFGTTGIGRPYAELLESDTRFYGHNSFEFIDAGEIETKTFQAFIVPMERLPEGDIAISSRNISIGNLTLKNLLNE